MPPEFSLLWNGALTIGVAIGMFMMNRVASTLDRLQKADQDLSDKVEKISKETIPRADVDRMMERLEHRIESYHAMQVETSKVIFAKLDVISDRLSTKIDRQECLQMMSERRKENREQ